MKAGKNLNWCVLLVFLHLSAIVHSQNECSKWIFGQGAGLDFMTNPPTVGTYTGFTANTQGCTSIADAAGNLLFYTDGLKIYNQAQQVMANSTGFSPSSKSIIVKKPGSSSLYYLFTINWGTLTYSTVDMSLSAGMGSVTVLNATVFAGAADKLTGTLHCNGRDYWIVTHGDNSNNFYSFLLSPAGINTVAVVSAAGSVFSNQQPFFGWGGFLKISPNGKKLGTSLYTAAPTYSDSAFELFDFDNSTGIISNPQSLIKQITGPFGCEFSPDGTKFYGSVFTANVIKIYQWDLCVPTGTANLPSLYTYTSNPNQPSYYLLNMQLAPDGKIYIGRIVSNTPASMSLAVINNPNIAGSGFNFQFSGLSIAPNQNTSTYLPHFMNSSLLPHPVSLPFTYTVNNGLCQNASFTAPPALNTMYTATCSVNGFSLTSQIWDFGDPASGVNNTSTVNNPTHAFSSLGTFTVQLIRYYTCTGGTDTLKQVVNINQPCVTVSSTSITCASLGSATATPLTGTGPYSYTWIPTNQTNSVATGLSPGTYTIQVFDPGNNYTYSTTTVFTSLIPLTGTLNNTGSLTCPGASNGTANVTNLAGGSGTVNYVWTNAVNSYTVPAPQNLTAGTWTVNVTDALTACQVHSVFTITEPPAFTLSIAASTPSVCLGGSIVVTGTNSGGTPGYSYNWINGPPSSSYTVAENSSGTFVYTLNAVDANTCAVSNTIAVDFVPNPLISIPTVSICPLETATLVASGATTYTWTGNVNGSTFTISPPATGNHSYAIAGSALGCVSTATGIVHVKSPPLVLLNSNSPVCEGGQLSLFATGGPGYQWSGPLAFTSTVSFPVITGALPAHSGVYNVTVTGVNGCTATASTPVLTVHPTPTLSATGATLCSSQTLVLNGSSVPGASFLWKGPLNFSSAVQNPVISHPPVSASGDYTLKVTSAQGCTAGAVTHVSVVPPPSLTVALSSPSLCAQAFNGSPNTITLTSSGADTYTLFTSSPVVSNDPNNPSASLTTDVPYLPAGISTATLVGSNGICEVSQTSTFSVIGNPTISIGSPTPVICAGENYTYTSHGADSYVWTSTTPNFTTYSNGGLAVAHPSIHSVFSVYGSSLGCNSALENSTITVNPIPSLSVTASQSAVCRFSQATLKATGNVTGFDWYPQLLMDAYSGNSATVTITADQVYTVTGSALGCTASAVALIRALDLPVAQISQSKHAYCIGEQVTLTGNGGLYYHWSGPHTFYRDGQVLSLALEHAGMAGVYTLVVTDKNGCRASALEEVTVIPFPFIQIAGPKSGCAPWCGEFELLGEHLSSSWQSGAQSVVQDENRFKLCFSKSGNYIVNGTITDQNTKCKTTQSFVVNVYEKPAADFTWLPEKPVAGIDEVLLLNNSTGQEQTRWRWYMEQDPAFRAETENASYFFPKEGSYPIVYVVQNAWNCADTIIKVVDIEADFVFYMPDAFTPNADSRNETFKPVLNGVTKYRMEVFNRWGERLFFTEDPEAGWDGYHQGQPCKQDSYVWRVVLTNVGGNQKSYSGSVVLVR